MGEGKGRKRSEGTGNTSPRNKLLVTALIVRHFGVEYFEQRLLQSSKKQLTHLLLNYVTADWNRLRHSIIHFGGRTAEDSNQHWNNYDEFT